MLRDALIVQPTNQPVVKDLDLAVRGDQDIAVLDVTMDLVGLVQVMNALGELAEGVAQTRFLRGRQLVRQACSQIPSLPSPVRGWPPGRGFGRRHVIRIGADVRQEVACPSPAPW